MWWSCLHKQGSLKRDEREEGEFEWEYSSEPSHPKCLFWMKRTFGMANKTIPLNCKWDLREAIPGAKRVGGIDSIWQDSMGTKGSDPFGFPSAHSWDIASEHLGYGWEWNSAWATASHTGNAPLKMVTHTHTHALIDTQSRAHAPLSERSSTTCCVLVKLPASVSAACQCGCDSGCVKEESRWEDWHQPLLNRCQIEPGLSCATTDMWFRWTVHVKWAEKNNPTNSEHNETLCSVLRGRAPLCN